MGLVNYAKLSTEQINPRSRHLDRLSAGQIVSLMNKEDEAVLRAIYRSKTQIARAINLATEALRTGGRLVFVGAGTSGRLGVLEAAECPPTFNSPPSLVQAIMAGGGAAVFLNKKEGQNTASKTHCAAHTR